jgi:hypothetical protein
MYLLIEICSGLGMKLNGNISIKSLVLNYITDPMGRSIGENINEIPNSSYEEIPNGEGVLVTILDRELGEYQITVVPETSANSTDTFSLDVLCGNQSIIIAENVSICDIPTGPYVIESTESGIVDETPPVITIHSLVNGVTYPADSVDLLYTVSEPTVWEGYSLDGAENVTLSGPTTLTGLVEGPHTLTVYATDTSGNTG